MSQNGARYSKAAIPEGRRVEWWPPDEMARFAGEAKNVSTQYSDFAPLPGFHVNGDRANGTVRNVDAW
jgi:predicted metalloendopeptidase